MRFLLLLILCFTPLSHAQSFLDRLPFLGGSAQPKFLPVDQAYQLSVSVLDSHTLLASFTITPGYYLYRDKTNSIIADAVAKTTGVKIANIVLPRGEMKLDPNFGNMEVFYRSFQAEITLERSNNSAQTFTLDATYQGCSEQGLCYAPTNKQINITLPGVSRAPAATPPLAPPDETTSYSTKLSKGDSQVAGYDKGGGGGG